MAEKSQVVTISPPNFETAVFTIKGAAPYMQCRFSQKAFEKMRAAQAAGPIEKKKTPKQARDFDSDFAGAQHKAVEGWHGIPATAFRNACIDVCRVVQGMQMTKAKMSIFIEADGTDSVDGTPLVKLIAKAPERTEMLVRNATGVVDIRVRPMWRDWSAKVRVRFDADQFKLADVTNLLSRAGMQVGIGEGRPFSKDSNGLGFGLFSVA